jgi:lipoyl synthase
MVDKSINKKNSSGEKYLTAQGCYAIKDGIKNHANEPAQKAQDFTKKPGWLHIKMVNSENFSKIKLLLREKKLNTVCEEAKCPNIHECWSGGTATLMVMGYVCTRACRFCAVDTGNPNGWLDMAEPENCAETVKIMNLKYVVITSVDRDDLPDGGASHYAACIRAIKKASPDTITEALAPDFQGDKKSLEILLDSGVDVFSQNVETVERLTHAVRDPRAGYLQTLQVLAYAKQYRPDIVTKTGLMLGLGETREEVIATMDDLRARNVDILTMGQYLQPTSNHIKIERYVSPSEFDEYYNLAMAKKFLDVASGPLVRSSYRADRVIDKIKTRSL